MKKGLLIYRINRDDPANSGVIKKCKAQHDAFLKSGFEVDMLWLSKKGVLLNEELIQERMIPPHSRQTYWFYLFGFGSIVKNVTLNYSFDFIYLRHPFFDPILDRSLRTIRKRLPNIKMILEINTFPYDSEPKRWLHRMSLKMDQFFRKKAHQYIDRIVDYGQRDQIWEIPTIRIRNGIDPDAVKKKQSRETNDVISMIAVGNWSYWHGLDRLIQGMKKYDGKKKIRIKIVGEGPEKEHLVNLSKDLNLEKSIQFLPATFEKELDRLFDEADLGIGTLGLHRKEVELDSSLKHREYCARGLPFILSSKDPDFLPSLSFVHYVSNNDSALDIELLINWVEKLDKKGIREYAEKQLSWERQMKPVFNWLKQQEN